MSALNRSRRHTRGDHQVGCETANSAFLPLASRPRAGTLPSGRPTPDDGCGTLNTNENPFPLPGIVMRSAIAALELQYLYPEDDNISLREAAAAAYGIATDRYGDSLRALSGTALTVNPTAIPVTALLTRQQMATPRPMSTGAQCIFNTAFAVRTASTRIRPSAHARSAFARRFVDRILHESEVRLIARAGLS
ncbi:hypothetical protein ABIB81_008550 [Bradyrhizobium sp. I1.7.5]